MSLKRWAAVGVCNLWWLDGFTQCRAQCLLCGVLLNEMPPMTSIQYCSICTDHNSTSIALFASRAGNGLKRHYAEVALCAQRAVAIQTVLVVLARSFLIINSHNKHVKTCQLNDQYTNIQIHWYTTTTSTRQWVIVCYDTLQWNRLAGQAAGQIVTCSNHGHDTGWRLRLWSRFQLQYL